MAVTRATIRRTPTSQNNFSLFVTISGLAVDLSLIFNDNHPDYECSNSFAIYKKRIVIDATPISAAAQSGELRSL
jgi:hypothetical protein